MRQPAKTPNQTGRPFLSIVTISFNQRQFLQQTIESVLSQKDSDVEYIVVDPGSTDGSRELLETYRGRIDRLVLEPDAGAADGLNKGFALATGQIGYFLNSDDFLLPNAIAKMRSLWFANPGSAMLLCSGWLVDGDGKPERELRAEKVTDVAMAAGYRILIQQGLSFKMDQFRSVGGFNTENRSCWDGELVCQMLQKGATHVVSKERIAAFRLHGLSITGGVGGARQAARLMADFERIHKIYLGATPGEFARFLRMIHRYIKYIKSPLWATHLLADYALPKRRQKRYNQDMKTRL